MHESLLPLIIAVDGPAKGRIDVTRATAAGTPCAIATISMPPTATKQAAATAGTLATHSTATLKE